MLQRSETTRAVVVVLEKEAIELRPFEYARDRLIVAGGVELALVVAAADVHRKRDSGVAFDDRVIHLDARVDQLLGVAAPLSVALAEMRVEQRRVLRRIDLDVSTSQAHQLVH